MASAGRILLAVFVGCASASAATATACGVLSAADQAADADADAGAAAADAPPNAVDATDATPAIGCNGAPACQRIVFVTKQTTDGAFGGLDAGDAICNDAANSSRAAPRVKGRTFRAWLSGSGTSAADRLVHGTMPYVLAPNDPDAATVISANWDGFASGADGGHRIPIDVDETGAHIIANDAYACFWSGTADDGAIARDPTDAGDCLGWTSAEGGVPGFAGCVRDLQPSWSAEARLSCNAAIRLLCVER